MSMRRFDLPLESTAAGHLLPWAVAGLVYLASVALGIAAAADSALGLYDLRARIATVTLPAVEDGRDPDAEVLAALDILRQTRGITSASPVSEAELQKLIEPWLGETGDSPDLPLPRLIDVALDPVAKPELPVLEERLREVAPGATIGVDAMARDRAEGAAAFVRAWSGIGGLLVLLASLGVGAMLTRMSLGTLDDTIETLRLMGASDGYLARQFERHALVSGLHGGLVGSALGLGTVLLLLHSGRCIELAGPIDLGLRPVDWVLLACVPVLSALLITAVARTIARRRLAKMP